MSTLSGFLQIGDYYSSPTLFEWQYVLHPVCLSLLCIVGGADLTMSRTALGDLYFAPEEPRLHLNLIQMTYY